MDPHFPSQQSSDPDRVVDLPTSDREEDFRQLRAHAIADAASLAGVAAIREPSTAADPPTFEAAREENGRVVVYDEPVRTMTVPLHHPFTIDGRRVEIVRLVPPAFGDVEAVTDGHITELEMHARMADLPVAALRAMRWLDIEAVVAAARRLAPDLVRS